MSYTFFWASSSEFFWKSVSIWQSYDENQASHLFSDYKNCTASATLHLYLALNDHTQNKNDTVRVLTGMQAIFIPSFVVISLQARPCVGNFWNCFLWRRRCVRRWNARSSLHWFYTVARHHSRQISLFWSEMNFYQKPHKGKTVWVSGKHTVCRWTSYSSDLHIHSLSEHGLTSHLIRFGREPFQTINCGGNLNQTHRNNNNHFTTIVQVKMYKMASQLRTRGFCWSKRLLPACPCWQQLAHLD